MIPTISGALSSIQPRAAFLPPLLCLDAMDSAGVSQAEMARRMKTSRAVVRRLLDDSDPSVTLATISRAALALGKQVRLKLAA